MLRWALADGKVPKGLEPRGKRIDSLAEVLVLIESEIHLRNQSVYNATVDLIGNIYRKADGPRRRWILEQIRNAIGVEGLFNIALAAQRRCEGIDAEAEEPEGVN